MEAMNQREETEQAAAAVALRRKLPRQHGNTANLTTTFSNGDIIFSSSESSLASGQAEEVKETPSNGTPISHKNGGTESPYEISGFNGGHVDFSFRKNPGDEILGVKVIFDESAFSITNRKDVGDKKVDEEFNGSGTLSSKQSVEQNGRYASGNNGTTEHGRVKQREIGEEEHGRVKRREISEQEASELYLERVYSKPAAHDFYCPNCNTCITEVIIWSRELEPPPPPVAPARCTLCFSFLTLAGSWLCPTEQEINSGNSVEVPIPSPGLNEPRYGISPTMPAQPIGVGDTASIDKPTVTGESVEASVGAKPSGNNSESGVEVDKSVPLHESNGTVHNKKPSVPVLPVGVGVLTTTKPPAPDPAQIQDGAGPSSVTDSESGETKTDDTKTLEIVKSIVYGGLTEAITSLGIVTSAASADTATMNILALALANLLCGLVIIGHNLWELKDDHSKVPTGEQVERNQKVLEEKGNFSLHASVAILSFIVFGLIPPVVYGFSFRQSNNRDLKIAAVAVASFLCIIVLATGKAYIQRSPKYIKTLLYYITTAIAVGGVSYLAGDLIDKLLEKLGWFPSTVSVSLPLPQMNIVKPALEFY